MKDDNRGLSLLEVVIVVTIMIILSAVGIIGVNMISGKPAERCAESIKVSLTSNRTTALGKYKAEMCLVYTGGKYMVQETAYKQDGSVEYTKDYTVGDKDVKVEYSLTSSTTGYSDLPATGLKISFDRGSGAVEDPSKTNDLYIRCSKAGKQYIVQLYHLTGKAVIID